MFDDYTLASFLSWFLSSKQKCCLNLWHKHNIHCLLCVTNIRSPWYHKNLKKQQFSKSINMLSYKLINAVIHFFLQRQVVYHTWKSNLTNTIWKEEIKGHKKSLKWPHLPSPYTTCLSSYAEILCQECLHARILCQLTYCQLRTNFWP